MKKKYNVPVEMEVSLLVSVRATIQVSASNEKEALAVVEKMKGGDPKYMKNIEKVEDVEINQNSLEQDLHEAIAGRKKGGIGGKVKSVDSYGEADEA